MSARQADPRHIDAADVAKLIRAELKLTFPGVKFSVKTDKYSMGASVDIAWTDGPTPKMVEHFTDKYAGKTFDGTDDSSHYHVAYLNGEAVRYGSDYVHTHRENSMGAMQRAAAKLNARAGTELSIAIGRWGIEVANGDQWCKQEDEQAGILLRRELSKTAIVPAGAVWGNPAAKPKKTKTPEPAKVATALRAQADRLEAAIVDKERPRDAGTVKRAGQADQAIREAQVMRDQQTAARALADHHDGGTVPAPLALVTHSTQLRDLITIRHFPELSIGSERLAAALMALQRSGMHDRPQTIKDAVSRLSEALGAAMRDKRPDRDSCAVPLTYQQSSDVIALAKHARESGLLSFPNALDTSNADARRIYSIGVTTPEQYDAARAAALLLTNRIEDPDELGQRRVRKALLNLVGKEIPNYYPTPPGVVATLIHHADIINGMRILEPSAGTGHIADTLRVLYPASPIDCIEINSDLRPILALKGHNVIGLDFEDTTEIEPLGDYGRIVMNPPFRAGKEEQHVYLAYRHLAPGGRLVSVLPAMSLNRPHFVKWLAEVDGEAHDLPAKSFATGDRSVPIDTCFVVIDKPQR